MGRKWSRKGWETMCVISFAFSFLSFFPYYFLIIFLLLFSYYHFLIVISLLSFPYYFLFRFGDNQ